jgi:hypothetical protein
MAYKYSVGKRDFGDIEYEDDVDTQIDFESDFIALTTGGTKVLIVSGSKVGIGISTPSQNLHVLGSGDTTLRVQGSDGYYGALNVKGGTGASAWIWQPADTSDLRFFTVDDDRMVILGSGEVGVGTTAPKTTLDVHHDPTALADNTGGGEVVTFGSGTLTAGKLYYLNSSGAWAEIDADSVTTSDGLLGIALGTGASDGVLLRGFFDATTYLSNFIKGGAVYLSTTAASMDTTAPSATGDIVRCVGWCTDTANVIYFNPSSTYLELS